MKSSFHKQHHKSNRVWLQMKCSWSIKNITITAGLSCVEISLHSAWLSLITNYTFQASSIKYLQHTWLFYEISTFLIISHKISNNMHLQIFTQKYTMVIKGLNLHNKMCNDSWRYCWKVTFHQGAQHGCHPTQRVQPLEIHTSTITI